MCVVGASSGLCGAVWAQAELRRVLATIGADVIEGELAVGQAQDAFDEQGQLADPERRRRWPESVAAVIARAARAVPGLHDAARKASSVDP